MKREFKKRDDGKVIFTIDNESDTLNIIQVVIDNEIKTFYEQE